MDLDDGPHPALATDAVLANIFAALARPAELASALRVCRQWRRCAEFDAVWQSLYLRTYGQPDESERCCSFQAQYRRARRLASSTHDPQPVMPLLGDSTFTVSAAYDPITGCLATVHAEPSGRLSIQVRPLERPSTPIPAALGWDSQLMSLGSCHELYSDKFGAIMPRAARPIAAHSGRCVFIGAEGKLAVTSLQPPGMVQGRLNVCHPEVGALLINSWMCVSVSPSGEALFWSLDRMASFGRQPLGFFLRAGPGVPSWSHRVAMAPHPTLGSTEQRSTLISIVNFTRTDGPHVLVFRADRTLEQPSGGVLTAVQVLPFSNPTSCCFSRGRLLVGSSMTRSAGHLHHFTAAVHVLDATSWEKQGILVSQEQPTVCPLSLLTSTPRLHALEGSVVLDVPRDGASQHFVLQFRVQHAVCAMALQGFINSSQAAGHMILDADDRLPLRTLVTDEHSWMEVSMLLSTPSRLLILTKLQMLLEMPLS